MQAWCLYSYCSVHIPVQPTISTYIFYANIQLLHWRRGEEEIMATFGKISALTINRNSGPSTYHSVAGFWARDRDKSELRFNGLFNKSEDFAPHIHKV